MGDCCIKGSQWDAKPTGREEKLAGLDCYTAGTNEHVSILMIHDLFGWTFPNIRLLADHFATEVGAAVYVPDFFGGEVLPADIVSDPSQWADLDLPGFIARNTKVKRAPEILECAKALRSRYSHIGAIGYCYGGWGVFQLASAEHKLVDCISTAHPTMLEKEEIRNITVPVQILAPEIDSQFTPELKDFCNEVIPSLGVPYDYQYFPGLEHGFSVRGNPKVPGEKEGMERAQNAAVTWFRRWLY